MATERPAPTDPAAATAALGTPPLALLRLLQLTSPALPVGAFAYSHGLEWAVEAGWVRAGSQAEAWIAGLQAEAWSRLDVPVLARLYAALECGDADAVAAWSDRLCASRESAELLAEDLHMGAALARLAAGFGVPGAADWAQAERCPFVLALAAVARHWAIPLHQTALGCLWTYSEHLVNAAVKLVPLGQTEGQQVLYRVAARIPAAAAQGLALGDEEIGAVLPGLAIASACHETQYSRLFRS
ncbi:MAG TPA: urease accessory UreF family protein [bacterium]|nr:urease accessory UreF family protein [bacterium]